jgi:hypothetical protein
VCAGGRRLERRTGASAQRLCGSESAAGWMRVEVDFAGAQVAPARKDGIRVTATVRLSDCLRRGFARRLRRDLGGSRRAGVGVGSAENVIDCTRMPKRACVCGARVPCEYWSSNPSVALRVPREHWSSTPESA